MLKISIQETEGGRVTLLLAGRIANGEGEQLRSSCREVLESGAKLTLDLGGISFIDRNGVAFIHTLEDQHVQLINLSPFVAEQLKRKKKLPTEKSARTHQTNKKGKHSDS